MDEEEKVLEDFFKEMKAKDVRAGIPDLHRLVPKENRNQRYFMKMAAAISLVVLGFAFWVGIQRSEKSNEIVEEIQNLPYEEMKELIAWEEPTKSLLEDF